MRAISGVFDNQAETFGQLISLLVQLEQTQNSIEIELQVSRNNLYALKRITHKQKN